MKNIIVSGSRGKTTIADFIISCCGKNDVCVMELNDRQCIDSDILVVSNIYDMDNYDRVCRYIANSDLKNAIINADDALVNKIFLRNLSSNLITCGMNQKASVTASSILYSEGQYKFNYCIQRAFLNLEGDIIEPMEIPVEINMYGQYNIYNSLFSITSLLLLGNDIKDIKKLVQGYKNHKNFEIILNKNFKLITHYAREAIDYINAFNVLFDISYNKLYLLYNIKDFDYNIYMIDKLIDANRKILNIQKVFAIDENAVDLPGDDLMKIGKNDLLLSIGSFDDNFNKMLLNYINNLS